MTEALDKVIALITRYSERGPELLLFQHPEAGIQIPAGTVELGEPPESAVLREAAEETGLVGLTLQGLLGIKEYHLQGSERVILAGTRVFSRPDASSFDWAILRRGVYVSITGREQENFSQVSYIEWDRYPDQQYISFQITGWIPSNLLGTTLRRHFFHLQFTGQSPARWTVFSDNHKFSPFWSLLSSLPEVVEPQNEWLEFLTNIHDLGG